MYPCKCIPKNKNQPKRRKYITDRKCMTKISTEENLEIDTQKSDTAIETTPLTSFTDSSFNLDNRNTCLNVDCDSEPDRSNPPWKVFLQENVIEESIKSTQEDSVNKISLWDEIMMGNFLLNIYGTKYYDKQFTFERLQNLEKPFEPTLPVSKKLSAVQYLDKYIFNILCPILEETLFKAKEGDCLMIQKCRFNGLDYIAELLWNRNPLHPKRHKSHRDIFDIPYVIIWLNYHPRPIYPLSWLWTKDEAIIVMQSYIRRYLVCKEEECSEMRQFWKILKVEKEEKERLEREKLIEELEVMFNEILNQLIINAVYEAEYKIHGCHCNKKPCHCKCRCNKWCKCCDCSKKKSK
ncbi:conserved hypothetical protein [Pediculus humanus corporis]|uniref:Uncharacterized protein n=1 Tax=Pediculus humanus subsp. corporis TaxID=121224 RepID=E0VGT2_PEDHC|nr:uncharacterized protein Phum_PHUM192470 [Pediculus humanus corporis]EEB12588.1 conserved hypothetical protein [Pediculus humanus corporis]